MIYERHRHRFEVNNQYRQTLEDAGMILSGQSPDGRLVEIVELRDHPWFVASQFHPEFKSRPERPHPLFDKFVEAALEEGPVAGERKARPERDPRGEFDGARGTSPATCPERRTTATPPGVSECAGTRSQLLPCGAVPFHGAGPRLRLGSIGHEASRGVARPPSTLENSHAGTASPRDAVRAAQRRQVVARRVWDDGAETRGGRGGELARLVLAAGAAGRGLGERSPAR